MDSFQENIEGVRQLVNSNINKTHSGDHAEEEGIIGDFEDVLTLKKTDEELLELRMQWENKSNSYLPAVLTRQERNKLYYQGKQQRGKTQRDVVVSSNLIFEAEETFIPQALSKNPEPVVWSDNTDEGKGASNDIKTMLQYHADVLCLRRKLGVMVRHWSIYFLGVVKHGWDEKINDITTEIRKPQNFILDPNGYVDEFGNFIGDFLGERIESTAEALIELYPKHATYIRLKVNDKMGTNVVRTEWWTDEFCFSTFENIILDKHKNEFFNYDTEQMGLGMDGMEIPQAVPGKNHFARPKMPYTFLSVFSLQERPHDITNLVEQNIPNQDRITERDEQISKNLRTGNNSLVISDKVANIETARLMAQAIEDGDPILCQGEIANNIQRLPASAIPSGIFQAQQNDKDALRSIFGTQGLTAQQPDENTTARGMILNQSHDSTRIGGGIGDALEQVADNVFNWWLQLYYVFYDEPHYAAIMGNGHAVEYVQLQMANQQRHFVVSVAPNSMQPKDEITEQNLAIDLASKGWLDPINLFKKLNYADPMETAKMVTLYQIDKGAYMQQFFPEMTPQQAPGIGNPPDMNQIGGTAPQPLSEPQASSALSQVPISAGAAQPQ